MKSNERYRYSRTSSAVITFPVTRSLPYTIWRTSLAGVRPFIALFTRSLWVVVLRMEGSSLQSSSTKRLERFIWQPRVDAVVHECREGGHVALGGLAGKVRAIKAVELADKLGRADGLVQAHDEGRVGVGGWKCETHGSGRLGFGDDKPRKSGLSVNVVEADDQPFALGECDKPRRYPGWHLLPVLVERDVPLRTSDAYGEGRLGQLQTLADGFDSVHGHRVSAALILMSISSADTLRGFTPILRA